MNRIRPLFSTLAGKQIPLPGIGGGLGHKTVGALGCDLETSAARIDTGRAV